MAVQDAATLKSYFNTGDVPTESQFADLIDTIDSKGTGGVTDHGALTGLEDNDHPQYSLATHNHAWTYEPADATIVKDADIGVTVAAFSHTHNYAPALGTDDNYVTNAEKSALHSHTNKAAIDKVNESGGVPTWNGGAWPVSGGGGDMYKSVYDPDADGVIAYAQLSGVAAALGADDNYVTDAEKTKLSNLSGTNTGDQDLSGYSLTSHNHSLNNLTEKSYSSLTDKPSIPSIAGLLDETAHDALDHTGLTGIPTAYSLPTATTTALGGVKVDGSTITINSGVISSSATGGGMTSESKSSSFTAVKDHRYIVDTSAGIVTATLPASPSAGDCIEFVDSGSTWTGHDLVLARNSLKINGETTDFTCDADNVQVSITYTGATYGWAVKVGASVLTAAPHTTGSHSDWPAGVSMTEVGYLDGVTALIQDVIVQRVEATPYSTYSTDNTHTFPIDNTIPQKTEGGSYCSVTITPTSASNKLVIEGIFYGGTDGANNIGVSICDTGINDCLAAVVVTNTGAGYAVAIPINCTIAAGSTATRTYQLRAGTAAGTLHINGISTSNQLFNGKLAARLSVTEVRV